MTRRTKWAIIITLLFLGYGLAVLWFWNLLPRPYERPPKPTQAEETAMEKARKQHGNYTQIVAVEGIYFERKGRNGTERVWIARRSRSRGGN